MDDLENTGTGAEEVDHSSAVEAIAAEPELEELVEEDDAFSPPREGGSGQSSTPERPLETLDQDPDVSPVARWRGLSVGRFEFLPSARNVPEDLLRLQETPPEEPNPRTSSKWKVVPPLCLKYVDDGVSVDKINFETAQRVGRKRLKHAVNSQNLFRHVVRKAESRGMVVNTDKTKLLVVSDACLLYTSPSPRD